MYLLKMLGLLAVCGCILLGTYRRLVRERFPRSWHIGFVALALLGVGLGIWFMSIRRMASPIEQSWGVPFAIAGGLFENGAWHNGGVGRFLYLALVADLGCGVALCIFPLTLLSFVIHNFKGRNANPG